MIDFIEYIVSELKSKRLTKTNAAALIKQFSAGASKSADTAAIVGASLHPLLHANTSDFSQQSYRTQLTGNEFFLNDHQVQGNKVLPGVAYLEMATAALMQAMPDLNCEQISLHNVVWAQPVVANQAVELNIALFVAENNHADNQIDFEIYSTDNAGKEVIHCQGLLAYGSQPVESRQYDIAELTQGFDAKPLQGSELYPDIARIGMHFGPAHQVINRVYRSKARALALLQLPAVINSSLSEYVLHPAIMDGALQAATGLTLDLAAGDTQPPLPFALANLQIIAPCSAEMLALVNYADGSKAGDNIIKLDIELIDAKGKVCVRFNGFSSRLLSSSTARTSDAQAKDGALRAVPQWVDIELPTSVNQEYAQKQLLLIGFDEGVEVADYQVDQISPASQGDIAASYEAVALACFEQLKHLMSQKLSGKRLIQIVAKGPLFIGLAGMLRSAAQEDPNICAQVIITEKFDGNTLAGAAELASSESILRLADNWQRQIWQTAPVQAEINTARIEASQWFKEQGVYLITGGLGGIGRIFADEILSQSASAQVILTGRSSSCDALDNARLHYRQLDLTDASKVTELFGQIKAEFGALNGVIHSAGMVADNFVIKKSAEEFSQVLAPKVTGSVNVVNAATRCNADFVCLFSSGAGLLGNVGQSDYAAANGFIDQYCHLEHQTLVTAIDWPLWAEGGMGMDEASSAALYRQTGMKPMQSQTGLETFYQALASQAKQMLVVEGDIKRIESLILDSKPVVSYSAVAQPVKINTGLSQTELSEKTRQFLRKQVAGVLKLSPSRLDVNAPMENYGIDSILAMELTTALEQSFGSLPKTLFFEYQTIADLTEHFVAQYQPQLLSILGEATLTPSEPAPSEPAQSEPAQVSAVEVTDAHEAIDLPKQTTEFLRSQLAEVLKLPVARVNVKAPMEDYGIDSILAMELTTALEQSFGTLPKTLFFEYQTIEQLAQYFVANHQQVLHERFAITKVSSTAPAVIEQTVESDKAITTSGSVSSRRARAGLKPSVSAGNSLGYSQVSQTQLDQPIAIVGLSGRYPESWDIQAYWQNLKDGKDCIVEVPKERWDWQAYYSEDRTQPGRHYSKWGGFIAGVDEFDPLFFGIPPVEVEVVDPQERLFLQHAWMAIEDAGYTKARLRQPHIADPDNSLPAQVGVYCGVMYSEYQLFGAQNTERGKAMSVPGSYSSVANRVSYLLNLHGPSMTIDSMCSSSLTAIHLASQDLKLGRTDLALAGGVNVSIHANKYLLLSSGQFISSHGHCQSFGEGGDGYIPGEGVGVVVLKRLADAKRDNHNIYGVIKGSALNHGGKTNGYSVPNPQAQAAVIKQALQQANVDARHISYLEAHGTGTKLGDPIEIAALTQAFYANAKSKDVGFCLVGSAKSNIGHCESAAGIAGLTKILLQMKHGQIVPSLHSSRLNPHIDFTKTPFIVNQTLTEWQRPVIDGQTIPRLAGISSFGAGGSNAHIVIEEYQQQVAVLPQMSHDVAILLSARTPEQLKQKASDLQGYLAQQDHQVDLRALAYTLQLGREAMSERLGVVVNSISELSSKLASFVASAADIDGVYLGSTKASIEEMALLNYDDDMSGVLAKWLQQAKQGDKYHKLLELWVKGAELDWSVLYDNRKSTPQWLSLPTYPFARQRYWVELEPPLQTGAQVLHPLLHRNISDFAQQSFTTELSGDEFFLTDHQVEMNGSKVKLLPGVASLELAREAIARSIPQSDATTTFALHNVVWAQPIVVNQALTLHIELVASNSNQIDFEIYSIAADERLVHCQGQGVVSEQPVEVRELSELQATADKGVLASEQLYQVYSYMGIHYGPAFQAIKSVSFGEHQVLAQLVLPIQAGFADYVLHPSLLDSAVHASLALVEGVAQGNVAQAALPFALDSLQVFAPCEQQMWVSIEQQAQTSADLIKLNIELLDNNGTVCVRMAGFTSRQLHSEAQQLLLAQPVFKDDAVSDTVNNTVSDFGSHQIITLAGLKVANGEALVAQGDVAERYQAYSEKLLTRLQTLASSQVNGKKLLQLLVPNDAEGQIYSGLAAMLKTATLEQPQLLAQLILVEKDSDLAQVCLDNSKHPEQALVRYQQGQRQVLRFDAISHKPQNQPQTQALFHAKGCYLITGGLGGLGLIFAREIIAQSESATVVLTGRKALNDEIKATIAAIDEQRVRYLSLDLQDAAQVKQALVELNEQQALTGIIHSAGMTNDSLLANKTVAQLQQVLAPKVQGTVNLDAATKDMALDFIWLFSSGTGALGNVGQADYAAANGFIDRFAAARNADVTRSGHTLAINWPLWAEGGMSVDDDTIAMMRRATGAEPLATEQAMVALEQAMSAQLSQVLVMQGDVSKLNGVVNGIHRKVQIAKPVESKPVESKSIDNQTAQTTDNSSQLKRKTLAYLVAELSDLIKLPPHDIDPQVALEDYGIDSVLVMKLTNQLEQAFGSLSKTLFFEYQTIAALADYFINHHQQQLAEKFAISDDASVSAAPISVAASKSTSAPVAKATIANKWQGFATAQPIHSQSMQAQVEVAIVGLAGRYPAADDVEHFWQNLQAGIDCVSEIPADRWQHQLYFAPERGTPGKTYAKWGGFIDNVDKFDARFFNISPKEAELIDPQERIFLETVWHTIEDAGYDKATISQSRVGVYVGVMYGQYELYGAQGILSGQTAIAGSSFASIANRVSYFFDFNGPSMALDTMCSSSLTALHLAAEDIRKGEVDAAIAGGVNLSIHPYKYLSLAQGNFAASDGRCRSFGAGGDGYVPGEGVGAILLKPLTIAEQDGDHIYGLVKATSLNHGGKTNGYTVPNPNAQAELICAALDKANIEPQSISYIETHGTGTSLGDPIEITGLRKAFAERAERAGEHEVALQSCPIGSVKSNIGHLESAAGIAAITKSLLQLKHNKLVPSLHAETLNPNIDFAQSPFVVQTQLVDWHKNADGSPRRIAVSSFGAGGSNGHVIIEEYQAPVIAKQPSGTQLILLSARDEAALTEYGASLLAFAEHNVDDNNVNLADIAYTLQLGRTAFEQRLALVVESKHELIDKLSQWQANAKAHIAGVYLGNTRKSSANSLLAGDAGDVFVASVLQSGDLAQLANLWVSGVVIDWSQLPRVNQAQRVSAPRYPFAKERFWLDTASKVAPAIMPQQVSSEKQPICFAPVWQGSVLAKADTRYQTVLVLADSQLALDCAEQVIYLSQVERLDGSNVDSFKVEANKIQYDTPDSLPQVIAHLADNGQLPQAVVHIAGHHSIEAQLQRNIYSLTQLAQGLIKAQQSQVHWLSIANGDLSATALGGFYKTLAMEKPQYRGKVIDGAVTSHNMAQLISAELAELATQPQAVDVRYLADGRRQVKALQTVALNPSSEPVPIKHCGVYIISGGLGGLGMIFAELLAREYQAKLVLLGRSPLSTDIDSPQQQKLAKLRKYGSPIEYISADVTSIEAMKQVVATTKAQFKHINGVIHSAGVNRDDFIINKDAEQLRQVIEPKVLGAIALDVATADEALDLFVLFSSVAGATGNVGQCDYAYANHFLDVFAIDRAQKRFGKSLSINWPFWAEGGMELNAENLAKTEQLTGISAMPTELGIEFWHQLLQQELTQAVVLYGDSARIAAHVTGQAQQVATSQTQLAPAPVQTATATTSSKQIAVSVATIEQHLIGLVSEVTKLAVDRIEVDDRFESFGIDSVMIGELNVLLEADFGELPKTLFYEYETIEQLAEYLLALAPKSMAVVVEDSAMNVARQDAAPTSDDVMVSAVRQDAAPISDDVEVSAVRQDAAPSSDDLVMNAARQDVAPTIDAVSSAKLEDNRIAIIGVNVRFPQADDIEQLWQNIVAGNNLIADVPAERWDAEALYDADPKAAAKGKIYCRWGGFIDNADCFDADFFGISAQEARVLDPQERITLQSVYAAIEDAGYTPDSIKQTCAKAIQGKAQASKQPSADVGVFVGVTSNTYHLLAENQWQQGNFVSPGSIPWSIANRVSYYFDFQGPSLPVDSACSSALVAMHLACESLIKQECQMAVASGVNLYLHPAKYLSFCSRNMIASQAKTCSFGGGDDGFVPGEGVGTFILKPLSRAVADNDNIHGIIAASQYAHAGRSNGYSAPNPNAQAALITQTLASANIAPSSIGYIEGHGTGTELGDSLEIVAINTAFGSGQKDSTQAGCALGSIKANIGHSESAAGIAGVAKLLMQMRHQQFAPTLHTEVANPNIDWSTSVCQLQTSAAPWPATDTPRRGMVNAFGSGGVNACVVIEQYQQFELADAQTPQLLLLSAKTEQQLQARKQQLIAYLQRPDNVRLQDIAYTLQLGREPMAHRLALVASSKSQALELLTQGSNDMLLHGMADKKLMRKKAQPVADTSDLAGLAKQWIAGQNMLWADLHSQPAQRVSLPSYPFAKVRHWLDDGVELQAPIPSEPAKVQVKEAKLHPLVNRNSSTLKAVSFTSELSASQYYAQDHQVNEQMLFPGAGYVELAMVAGSLAAEQRVSKIRDIVWIKPLTFADSHSEVNVTTYLKTIGDHTEVEVTSINEDFETQVHFEGRLMFEQINTADFELSLPIEALKQRCTSSQTGDDYYQLFQQAGFGYGEAFNTIKQIHVSDSFALAQLNLTASRLADFDQYLLHPCLIDGALQAVSGLVRTADASTPYLPFALNEIELLRPLTAQCYVYVTYAGSGDSTGADVGGMKKFNMLILNQQGQVLAKLNDFYVRALVSADAQASSVG